MDKLKKEVGNKKHYIRRAFIAIGVGIVLAGAAVGALTAFSASPLLIVLEGAVLFAGVGLVVEGGVAVNKIYEKAKIGANKKIASSSMEEIKELNQDRSSKYTKNYRAKVVKKFANANLGLAKAQGSSVFGIFHSNSGMHSEKATQLLNEIDALTLLRDSAKTSHQERKYSKKIRLAQEKLTKITGGEILSTPYKWSKTYDNVLPDVSVIDRRTEIYCLTQIARDAYADLFQYSNEKANNRILNCMVHFNDTASIRPTMARAEDETKVSDVKSILLKDVVEACKTKSALEIKSMFPISLETKVIDKKTTKILGHNVLTFNSVEEIKDVLYASSIR